MERYAQSVVWLASLTAAAEWSLLPTRLFANARFAGAARVEVMTIHAAKGLEFDTVIVPGLHRYLPNYNRELLRWTLTNTIA